jgi:hypothetical protein
MTWIRLESERYPPPAPTTDDQPMIDAEYRVIHEPQERARWCWRARRAEPRLASRADLMPALKATFGAALRTPSMLVPFWTIRVLLIILLWPVADLVRMTAVTLACLMILMRPFIQFFYVASFVAFCAMWSKIIGGHSQPAGAFAFWSVALGAIPAIWDVILGFIAPDMDLNTVNG